MSTENFGASSLSVAAAPAARSSAARAWLGRSRSAWAAAQHVVAAIATNVFPGTCGSCHTLLMGESSAGLCSACYDVLEPNIGRRCQVCDAPIARARCCERCRQSPPAFDCLCAPWIYGGPLADLVWAAKFRRAEHLARQLGRLILAAPHVDRRALGNAQAIVPVPLGRRRCRERGYNQATYIANVLSQAWHLPVWHALRRCRDTIAQSALPVLQRHANMEAAFTPARVIRGGRVVLVDDVVTSGETAREAAAALRRAGAAAVIVVAAARAELRD